MQYSMGKEVFYIKGSMGKTDRIIRVFIGLVIIAVGVYLKSWWGAIGLVPIFTAVTGWCGLYKLFGISTCKKTKKRIFLDMG
jgi:hypothetical protein